MTLKRQADSTSKTVWYVVAVLILIAFVVVEVQHVAPMIAISNVDYFPMVERALQLSLRSWDGWVSWKHPVGQSLLIRLGYELGFDVERVGQAWSILGGVLLLCGTWVLARSVFHDRRMAIISMAFAATSSVILLYSSIEGNDLMAAGLQVLSLSLLAATTLKQDDLDQKLVFLGGLLTGLAYLIRYNGMVTAMASGLWLVTLAIAERRRPAAWKAIGIYVAGFLLGSAIQWIPSLIVTGNPFYTDQGQNIWFHVFGKTDYLREWQQAPADITVFKVFAMDPVWFIRLWWSWFKSFWVDPAQLMLDVPLKLFGQAGLVFLLLAPGPASKKLRSLLGLFVLAHVASIAMMELLPRYLVMLIPLLTIGAVYLLAAMIPPHLEYRKTAWPLNVLVLLAGLIWAAQGPLDFATKPPATNTTVIQASNALYAGGMRSASEVLSTHTKLQDANSRDHLRFVQAYWVTPDLGSVEELTKAMQSQGWRFFIYHRDDGMQIYPSLKDVLSPDKCPPGMTPVYFHDNGKFVICRLNESADGYVPVGAWLENGIVLEGYEAHLSQAAPAGSGRQMGIYLHWRTERKIDNSLKVFVHLLDSAGQVVAQDDSVPVLWTQPTDEWKPGEAIIDFHAMPISASVPPGDYSLQVGLYDDASGIRLKRADAPTNSPADAIVLTKINLNNP